VKRHLDNFEGAFPLLMIGSVLLVYAGILASQQIGSHSSHLPLWGLLGGVGAVIVGAGVYSSFLEPEGMPTPSPSDDWVTVPRAEWEARTRGGTASARSRTRTEGAPTPIWWEDTVANAPAPVSPASPPTGGVRASRAPSPAGRFPVSTRPRPPAGVIPRPSARYSFRELSDQLSELEALVYGGSVPFPRKPATSPSRKPAPTATCMDCDRPLTPAASSTPCRSCGRGLCARCADSSKAEDGDVRCVECRASEP